MDLEIDTRLNNIRASAILIVMLGHSIIIYSPAWGIYNTGNSCAFFSQLKDLINILQMPVFFSLSGFLFKNTLAKRDAGYIIKNKIMRLIVPYFFIGLFYMLPIRLIAQYPQWQGKALWKIILFDILLGYDNGHLWYLYSLFIIFCLSIFLKNVIRRRTLALILFFFLF